jgi:hypothetical protein
VKFFCVIFVLALFGCSREAREVLRVPVAPQPVEYDHNHTVLGNVLEGVVDFGLVDYDQLLRRRVALEGYLLASARVPRPQFDQWQKAERMAFLLNIYNATTLKLLADHYPLKSIKDISTFPSVWKLKVVRLFGDKYSLDDLEHGMIREQFKSPQIHFALVCGARSCPPLRKEPYTAPRLETQFREQAQVFLRDAERNRVDLETRIIHLSPLFKWYAEDFGQTEEDLRRFIAPHLSAEDRLSLEGGGFRIEYTDYDWTLNRQPVQK